jgi:hypothetical protein
MKFENEAVERVYKRFLARDIEEVKTGGNALCGVFMAGYSGDQAQTPRRDTVAYGAYIAGKMRRNQAKGAKKRAPKKPALDAAPDTEQLREDAVAVATGNTPRPKTRPSEPKAIDTLVGIATGLVKVKDEAPVFEPVQALKALGDGEYQELPHERALAHIKVVKNEKVAQLFGNNKKSFGVFWGERLLGHIELAKGNVMWTVVMREGGSKQAKSPADAIYAMIQGGLEAAIKKEIGDDK